MKLIVSKSKNSESFYIGKSFIDDSGKSTSKVVKKLGTLSQLSRKLDTDRDGVMEWCKLQVKKETELEKKESERVLIPFYPSKHIEADRKNLFNCSYLFLQDILYDMKFKNIIRNIDNRHEYDYDLEAIVSDLVYARILEPCSKRGSYELCKSFLEPPKYDIHNVYRALSVIAQEDDHIQSELYKNSNFVVRRNNKVLYYDCTNYYFEIEQEDDLRKYGKGKDHKPNPIVQMGLFMDGDGIPLAYNLFPGNQSEQSSMTPTESKIINEFGFEQFIICTDAGLASKTNKRFNHVDGRCFIITQSIKKLKKETKEWALSAEGFQRVGDDTIIKDITKVSEEDKDYMEHLYYKVEAYDLKAVSQALIITYSPKYAAYQKNIRDKQLARAHKMVENGNIKRRRKNENDPARFISKKPVSSETGEVVDNVNDAFYVDEEKVKEEARYDGFYALTTDIENGDIKDILTISERRWEIEESFRIMKTDFSARPVYLQREERIRAHFLTCYIALLVYRILEKKSDNKYTTEQILTTLRSMKLLSVEGYGYVPAYTRTEITDKLHSAFGFYTDFEIISKSKMRTIIKNTKL